METTAMEARRNVKVRESDVPRLRLTSCPRPIGTGHPSAARVLLAAAMSAGADADQGTSPHNQKSAIRQ